LNFFLYGGVAILAGTLGAKLSRRFRIPQVVGYIIIGVILGSSVLNLISLQMVDQMHALSNLALAFIGFTIGGELAFSNLRELGTSILAIAFFEALTAFALVLIIVYLITGNLPLALIFGALASATAPAATVDVLWEYKSKGPLTTTLFAVVGIDDGIALIIYGFASSIARALITHGGLSLKSLVIVPGGELLGSVFVGVILGLALTIVVTRIKSDADYLLFALGAILLGSAAAQELNLSLILTNMIMGVTVINVGRRREAFSAITKLSPPFYLFFFILVGAMLQLKLIVELGFLGLAYIIFRTSGKSLGAWFGAKITRAPEAVRKYLGFGLLSQAGVAIGLAIETASTFRGLGAAGAHLAILTVNVITGTTFVYQVLGPPLTKYAITKAGEVGKAEKSR
jgi:Kef-type K+ transport system membrane component KefB